jgi:hypothetical protein
MESGQETNRRSPLVLIIGAAALLVLIGVLYWASRYAPEPVKRPEIPLPESRPGPCDDKRHANRRHPEHPQGPQHEPP